MCEESDNRVKVWERQQDRESKGRKTNVEEVFLVTIRHKALKHRGA